MAVKTNSPSRLRSRVDKAEEIFLARFNFPHGLRTGREISLGVVAVEDIVGCAQWSIVGDEIVFLSRSNVEAILVSGASLDRWMTYRSEIMTVPRSTS